MIKQFSINMVLLLAVLLLGGCGTTAHTMSHNEAVEARLATSAHATNTGEVEPIHEHPIYNMPIAQVWPIVRSTLSTFCDGKLAKVDESNYHLEAKNQNVWAGDTYVVVSLEPDQQRTIVKVAVRDYGWNRNLVATRSPHILSLFLDRLDMAMKQTNQSTPDAAARLQTLDDLKAKGLITEEEYQQKRVAILNGL